VLLKSSFQLLGHQTTPYWCRSTSQCKAKPGNRHGFFAVINLTQYRNNAPKYGPEDSHAKASPQHLQSHALRALQLHSSRTLQLTIQSQLGHSSDSRRSALKMPAVRSWMLGGSLACCENSPRSSPRGCSSSSPSLSSPVPLGCAASCCMRVAPTAGPLWLRCCLRHRAAYHII
jgi:hypothetical protein